jgi:hypothetical protein
MTMIDIACWERGCPCHDIGDEGVDVVNREWVGLSEYQRVRFADRYHIPLEAVEVIEAMLKEKNT